MGFRGWRVEIPPSRLVTGTSTGASTRESTGVVCRTGRRTVAERPWTSPKLAVGLLSFADTGYSRSSSGSFGSSSGGSQVFPPAFPGCFLLCFLRRFLHCFPGPRAVYRRVYRPVYRPVHRTFPQRRAEQVAEGLSEPLPERCAGRRPERFARH